jgi:hypothetical protein
MLYEIAAQAGLGCNPFTSASCIARTIAGAGAGSILGPGGIVIGGLAGNSGVAGAVAQGAANSAIGALASSITSALATMAKDTTTFWTGLPSPDLNASPVPRLEEGWLLPITVAVALIGCITAAIRMMLTRKAAPLAEVGAGLVTVAAASAVATALPELMLKASDAFASYVLNASTGGQFEHRFGLLLAGTNAVAPGLVIVLGIVALIMSALQAILLLFRLGAVVILSGTLPLAAAGQLTPRTRPWLWRVLGWELSLIWYKAAAALVYAVGFALIGTPGSGTVGFLMGITVLLLSLVALPALMRFFTWTTGQVEPSGGSGFLGAVIGGASAVGAMRGFGSSAAGQASAVNQSMGSAGGVPGGASGGQPAGAGGPGQGGPQAGGGQARPGPAPGAAGGGQAGGGSTAAASGARAGTASAAPAGGATAGGAAAATGGGATAGGAAAGGAAAGMGPAGVVIIAGQAAAQAGRALADGATTPPGQQP